MNNSPPIENGNRNSVSRIGAPPFTFPLNNSQITNLIRSTYNANQNNFVWTPYDHHHQNSNPRRTIPLSAFLPSRIAAPSATIATPPSNSVVINLDDRHQPQEETIARDAPSTNGSNFVNDDDDENAATAESLRQVLETHRTLQAFLKYIPFALILLFKCFYDNGDDIINFVVLLTTFTHCNSVVKKETAKQSRRNLFKLLLAVFYITACLIFIHFVQKNEDLYSYMVLIPPLEFPSSVWNLLWTIAMADFILKLFTIFSKIILASLPARIIKYQKRGKYFLFLEAISQLYRSLVPIQLWLHFLLDFYHGAEKFVGVILSAAYMVSKGSDLMSRLKLCKEALFKLLKNVSLGSSPNKEQLSKAGSQCPICHDEYEAPVLLTCKHIFCETCVTTWFDREQTCPLCRAKIVDDPSWRDGSTTFFLQLY